MGRYRFINQMQWKILLEIRKPGDKKKSASSCLLFEIKENAANGNCLFLSILDFLNDNKEKFKNIPNENNSRIQAVNYILSRSQMDFNRIGRDS